MLREIVFDTETTGLNPLGGDRVVEIGCVELIDYVPTGENFHVYLNPERDMPDAAFRVHGLSNEFLRDKPRFVDIADDFEAFIGDAKLVAHNASFDLGFLNAELERAGKKAIAMRGFTRAFIVNKIQQGSESGSDITYNTGAMATETQRDIVDNPKQLKFRELDSAMLPRVLDQVDLALINTNYALEAKLSPAKDALFIEKTSPYANVLVARPDNQNSAALKKLDAALHSPEARKFIEQKYQGAVVPAF